MHRLQPSLFRDRDEMSHQQRPQSFSLPFIAHGDGEFAIVPPRRRNESSDPDFALFISRAGRGVAADGVWVPRIHHRIRHSIDALPVCRFYGTPGRGPNSHFFTVSVTECAAVKLDPGWTFEGTAFYAYAPVNGQCATGQQPVYRAYNNRFARND